MPWSVGHFWHFQIGRKSDAWSDGFPDGQSDNGRGIAQIATRGISEQQTTGFDATTWIPKRQAGRAVAALIAPVAVQGRARRSPLFRWLTARHDAFAAMRSQYPATWGDLASALASLGVTDGQGQAPTGERVRKTWWDARHYVLARRARRSQAIPLSETDQISPGVVTLRGDDGHVPRSRPRLDIRPALPRNARAFSDASSTGGQAVHAVPAKGHAALEQATDVQRILDAMDKHKPGIPKLITGED